MYTSVGLFALATVLQSALPTESQWLRDYGKGQSLAARENKPLVVVVGTGADGFEKLAQDGKLGQDVQQALADDYVCVYLDRSRPEAAKLAKELSIGKDNGIVISDRKGEVMAFHHDGTLSQNDLKTHLRTFADPALKVRTTQTGNSTRYSYYPGASAPVRQYPSFGGYPAGGYSGGFAPYRSFAPSFGGGGGC